MFSLSVFILSALYFIPSHAETLNFQILDDTGAAVENAVLTWKEEGTETHMTGLSKPAIMDQKNTAFDPEVLVIPAGTDVSFPNSDNVRHHVYSFSKAKKFEIKLYSGEPTSPINFDEPGVVVLGCNIHDVMLGYIYVSDTPLFAMSDKSGFAQVEIDTDSVPNLNVWHPNLNKENKPVSLSIAYIKQNGQKIILDMGSKKKLSRKPKTALEKRFEKLLKNGVRSSSEF